MLHRETHRPVRALVLRVDVHPPFAYYRVGGGDDLREGEREKSREREKGSSYLQSKEIGVKGVDVSLPRSLGSLAGVEDGGRDQGAVAVLRPISPVHGEHQRYAVRVRVVIPGQGEVQVELLAASHYQPRPVAVPAHRLVPRRSVLSPVLADARVHVQNREHRYREVLPCATT